MKHERFGSGEALIQSLGITDFSLPDSGKQRRTRETQEGEIIESKNPHQELYLQRMIERFGILPETSPIFQEVQRAVDLFKDYVDAPINRVVVINSGEINALVFFQGDTIFMHRGLLQYLHDCAKEGGYEFTVDQIAGVLAHEAGHLEQGTGEREVDQKEEGKKNEEKDLVHRKELEYDADRRAPLLLEQAGLNPLEYVKVMAALIKLSDQAQGYSQSHPRSYKRMTDIEALVRSPETVASITRPLTKVSEEFTASLEGGEAYPHVDDQILHLQGPEDLHAVMSGFDNPADKAEWMQHYILYEQYRIVREQIETAECKRDVLYKVFFSNLEKYVEQYLGFNLNFGESGGTDEVKRAPYPLPNEGLMAVFFKKYGAEPLHRREPIKFYERTSYVWKKNAEFNQHKGISVLIERIEGRSDLEDPNLQTWIDRWSVGRPENFSQQVHYQLSRIISKLERAIASQWGEKIDKTTLRVKKEKLIDFFNILLTQLPDFSDPEKILERAHWGAKGLDVDLSTRYVEEGKSAEFVEGCLLNIGDYVTRSFDGSKNESDESIVESQQFKRKATASDILDADQTPEGKKKLFQFILMRHAFVKTFGSFGQYERLFCSHEEAYPEFSRLCDSAQAPFAPADADMYDLIVHDFLGAYLSLEPRRSLGEIGHDIRSQRVEQGKLEYLSNLSLSKTQTLVEEIMKKNNWEPTSGIGPHMQVQFPRLKHSLAGFSRDHVKSILDAYRGKLHFLLNWKEKIEKEGRDTVLAEVGIRNWVDYLKIGENWAAMQLRKGEDFRSLIEDHAKSVDTFLISFFEFYKSGCIQGKEFHEFFIFLIEIKVRSGQNFSIQDFITYCNKYPDISLELTLPELMSRGILPKESSFVEEFFGAISKNQAQRLLQRIVYFDGRGSVEGVRAIFFEYICEKASPDILVGVYFDEAYVDYIKETDDFKEISEDDVEAKVGYFLSRGIPIWDRSFKAGGSGTSFTSNLMRLFLSKKTITVQDGADTWQSQRYYIPDDINWYAVHATVKKYRALYGGKYGEKAEQVFDIMLSDIGMLIILEKQFKSVKMISKDGKDSEDHPTINEFLKSIFLETQDFSLLSKIAYTDPEQITDRKFVDEIDTRALQRLSQTHFLGSVFDYFIQAGVSAEDLIDEIFRYLPPTQQRDGMLSYVSGIMTAEKGKNLLARGLAHLPKGKEREDLSYKGLAVTLGKLKDPTSQEYMKQYETRGDRDFSEKKDREFGTNVKGLSSEPVPYMFAPGVSAQIYEGYVEHKFSTDQAISSTKLRLLKDCIFTNEFFDANPHEAILKLAQIEEWIPEACAYKDYLIERVEKKARESCGLGGKEQALPWYFKFATAEQANPQKGLGPTGATFLHHFYSNALPKMSSDEKRIRMGRIAFTIWKYQIKEGTVSFRQELKMICEVFPEYSVARDHYLIELMEKATNPAEIDEVKALIVTIQPISPDKKVAKANDFIEKFEEGLAFMDRPERQHLFFWIIGHPDYKSPPDTIRYLGVTNACTFNTVPQYFGALTFEEQKKFLRTILRGENGILDESLSTDQKQISEAKEVGSQTIEKLFDYLFPEDKVEAKYRSVYKTIFTTLMQELDSERRIQLVFSILRNFQEGKQPRVEDIMASILNIGVAFKKAAQILSERKDLLPAELCETLSGIKDGADPISKAAVMEIFKRSSLLDSLESIGDLLGTASVGQVHKVKIQDGREMVGKIKSPVVDKYREEDIVIISRIIAKLREDHNFEVPDFAEDISKMLDEESEFTNELVNRNLLVPVVEALNNKPRPKGEVKKFKSIEIVLPEITEARGGVLIEDMAKGYSLNDLYYFGIYERHLQSPDVPVSEKTLARGKKVHERIVKERKLGHYREAIKNMDEIHLRMIDLVVSEIFEQGVFHADMHRGNIMLEANEETQSAKLTLIDFGNVIKISPENQGALKVLFRGLAVNNRESIFAGMNTFMGRPLPKEAEGKIQALFVPGLELKEKIEKLSLVIRDYFEYEERHDFVNILKGLISSFYIFEDLSGKNRAVGLSKIMAKFF